MRAFGEVPAARAVSRSFTAMAMDIAEHARHCDRSTRPCRHGGDVNTAGV